MKEIKGKNNNLETPLPKKFVIYKETITDQRQIANIFNNYFATIGPKLVIKMFKLSKFFDTFGKKVGTVMLVTNNKLKEASS